MRFILKQRSFFLLTACFLVAASLYLLLSGMTSPDPPSYRPFISEEQAVERSADIIRPETKSEAHIFLHPKNPKPGDFVVIEAGPLGSGFAPEINLDFAGEISNIYRTGNLLYAVVAICYETSPGRYTITINNALNKGNGLNKLEATFAITDKEFQEARFSMPAGITEGWDPQRLAREREMIREAMLETEPYPLWMQRFIEPLEEGKTTSAYGAIRIIDGNPPRRHGGIDLTAEKGTPIYSPNRGIVRLADSLMAGGKAVIIDHGLDLSSSYMHLDSIAVEEDDIIERGQLLGTLGETGYATGPHLHWEVNVGLTPVNPKQILDNDLLWIPPDYVEKKLTDGY
ncbi:MAG: M23 family metallopeptidase [Bacillota bacterium]